MSGVDHDEERIATNRQEAFELREAARDHLRRLDQIMRIGAAFAAAAATVAVKYREIVLGIPSAILLLIAYAAQAYTDVVTVDRARDAAESALQKDLGLHVMFYGQLAVPYRKGKYLTSAIGNGVAGAIIAVGACIGGGIVAYDTHLSDHPLGDHTVFVAYLLATAWFLVVAALSLGDLFRAARDSAAQLARIRASFATPDLFVAESVRRAAD
jgi:hypothetical protein